MAEVEAIQYETVRYYCGYCGTNFKKKWNVKQQNDRMTKCPSCGNFIKQP